MRGIDVFQESLFTTSSTGTLNISSWDTLFFLKAKTSNLIGITKIQGSTPVPHADNPDADGELPGGTLVAYLADREDDG
ncbi:MAG: hypothetical protein KUG83_07820 [Gammaproteobacteria bacterium]|nr:hypothetical protein [Gammaproteobacteria bacterium]